MRRKINYISIACACIGHVRAAFSPVRDLGPLAQFNTKSVTHPFFYVKNVIFIISLMCRTRERCVFAYRVAPFAVLLRLFDYEVQIM